MARPKKAVVVIDSDSDSDIQFISDRDDATKGNKKKKAKRTKRKGKGKVLKGQLASFMGVPLDILAEICSHLDPLTLLYLARTNKSLRAFFISRRSRAVWVRALKNVFFPDLDSPDWSEPALASLLFESNCHVCDKPHAKIVELSLCVRVCSGCREESYVDAVEAAKLLDPLHPSALACTRGTLSAHTHYFLSEVRATNNTLWKHDKRHKKRLVPLVSDFFKPISAQKAGVPADDPDEIILQAFIASKKETVAFIRSDVGRILDWEKATVEQRKQDAEEAAQRRCTAIIKKLEDLGHDRRDIDACTDDSRFHQPRDLTDSIWNSIKSSLVKEVEEMRERRLVLPNVDELEIRYEDFQTSKWKKASHINLLVFPSFHAFLHLDSVKPLWCYENAVITDAAWRGKMKKISKEVRAYITERETKFFVMVAQAIVKADIGELSGQLASVLEEETVDEKLMESVFSSLVGRLVCTNCGGLAKYSQDSKHGEWHHVWVSMPADYEAQRPSIIRATHLVAESLGLTDASLTEADLHRPVQLVCVGCTRVGEKSEETEEEIEAQDSAPMDWSTMKDHLSTVHGKRLKKGYCHFPRVELYTEGEADKAKPDTGNDSE